MKLARCFAALFVFFFLVVTSCLAADWPPISPEELSMTDVKEQPGAPAVILYREQTDDDINSFHHTYVRMKILREGGRDIADVAILYNRRWWTVGDITGRTVHPDGSVVPFTAKPFDKKVMRGQGFQENITTFTLPDVQVGSIIDYQYDLRVAVFRGDRMFLSDPLWIIQENFFQRKAVFKYTPQRSDVLHRYGLRRNSGAFSTIRGVAWSSYLPPDQAQPQSHDVLAHAYGSTMPSEYIDLQLANIPPAPREPYMPPIDLLRWRVKFYTVIADKKEELWKTYGKFWNEDTETFLKHDGGVRDAVAQTVAATDTAEQKVRKIYGFVAKLENWDYIPERSKREDKVLDIKKNENAGNVLINKGGNHNDLNRLFASMVRATGVPAYMIWVPDRSHELFDDNFLSTRQFDAEIAIVQLDGKEVFLDPGSKYCPFGLVDWRYSSQQGLRQNASGAGFGETPFSNYKQSIVTRGANLQLTGDGSAQGTVTLTFMGLQAMTRRQAGGYTDEAGRHKLLEDELRKTLPGNSEVSLISSPDWENSETPLIAQFKVTIPLAVKAGKRWTVSQHLFQVVETAKFSSSQRVYPIHFAYPWEEVDETHISLPPNAETESLAPDSSLQLDYALYTSQQKLEAPGKLFSRRKLVMASGDIPAANYKDLKTFFDSVKSSDDQPALVKVSQNVATVN